MNPALGFGLALTAGLVWSVGNIVHKILASRLIQSTLLMVVSFSIVFALIGGVLLIWFPTVTGTDWWLALLGAVCYVTAVWAYLSAMRTEEASRIVPLFSIGSVLIVLFSAVLLGEVFTAVRYIGIGLVLVGSVLISMTTTLRALVRSRLVGFMSISGVAFAGHALIVKYLLADYAYGTVFGSIAVIQACIGLVLVIVLHRQVSRAWQRVSWKSFGLNLVTDFFGFGAELLYTIALSVWYLALVETIASLQYLFIFFWGIILSRYFPRILREPLGRGILLKKGVAVTIIIVGIYLIT